MLLFLFLYLTIIGWEWNSFFDIDPVLNVLAFLLLIVLIPLSAMSAQKTIDLIHGN